MTVEQFINHPAHETDYIFFRNVVCLTSAKTSFLFSDLINLDIRRRKVLKTKDNWTELSCDKIIKELPQLTKYIQNKNLPKLIDLKLITVKSEGVPKKKYYSINYELLVPSIKGDITAQTLIDGNSDE